MQWASTPTAGPRREGGPVHAAASTDSRGALCAATGAASVAAPATAPAGRSLPGQPLFPPKDADAEARRRWLATSPWPEVVFAAAV
jgi:hypothetical protein